VLTAVDPDRVLSTLNDLVAVPSTGGSEGEVAVQHLLADRLADLGLTVDLWPLDLPACARPRPTRARRSTGPRPRCDVQGRCCVTRLVG